MKYPVVRKSKTVAAPGGACGEKRSLGQGEGGAESRAEPIHAAAEERLVGSRVNLGLTRGWLLKETRGVIDHLGRTRIKGLAGLRRGGG